MDGICRRFRQMVMHAPAEFLRPDTPVNEPLLIPRGLESRDGDTRNPVQNMRCPEGEEPGFKRISLIGIVGTERGRSMSSKNQRSVQESLKAEVYTQVVRSRPVLRNRNSSW